MEERRVKVWVQRFKDRPALMLQWLDPATGKRKSESAQTTDEKVVEDKRRDKEYELNHGLHQDVSRTSWERFRQLFEEEHLPNCRPRTQDCFGDVFDAFEAICAPRQVRAINERTISAFVAGLRKRRGRGGNATMAPYTVKVYLAFLHIALVWAVEQKMLAKCPKFPSVKVPKKFPQPVPAESFERLLAKAPDANMRAYLLCGWRAGLRLNEALALEWDQTDKAPWADFGRDRIWLPAGFVKAVADGPVGAHRRRAAGSPVGAPPPRQAGLPLREGERGPAGLDQRGLPRPAAGGQGRREADHEDAAEGLRLLLRGPGLRPRAPEAHAARQHQDHARILRQLRFHRRGGRPAAGM
jgi:hypothetical protein